MGTRWKNIDAEEKARWQTRANVAKVKYQKDLAEYKKTKQCAGTEASETNLTTGDTIDSKTSHPSTKVPAKKPAVKKKLAMKKAANKKKKVQVRFFLPAKLSPCINPTKPPRKSYNILNS